MADILMNPYLLCGISPFHLAQKWRIFGNRSRPFRSQEKQRQRSWGDVFDATGEDGMGHQPTSYSGVMMRIDLDAEQRAKIWVAGKDGESDREDDLTTFRNNLHACLRNHVALSTILVGTRIDGRWNVIPHIVVAKREMLRVRFIRIVPLFYQSNLNFDQGLDDLIRETLNAHFSVELVHESFRAVTPIEIPAILGSIMREGPRTDLTQTQKGDHAAHFINHLVLCISNDETLADTATREKYLAHHHLCQLYHEFSTIHSGKNPQMREWCSWYKPDRAAKTKANKKTTKRKREESSDLDWLLADFEADLARPPSR